MKQQSKIIPALFIAGGILLAFADITFFEAYERGYIPETFMRWFLTAAVLLIAASVLTILGSRLHKINRRLAEYKKSESGNGS